MELMSIIMLIVFILGYLLIAVESKVEMDKSATALMTGVLLWVVYIFGSHDHNRAVAEFTHAISGWTGIIFFVMGAMTIVELMDSHNAFNVITERITAKKKKMLLWIISLTAFVLSGILDNLTTTVAMIALTLKMVRRKEDILIFSGMIVIAANAGGAYSPIGDVTTTMLWIGGQISAFQVIRKVFLPSLVSFLVPLVICTFMVKGNVDARIHKAKLKLITVVERDIIFLLGLAVLLFVPVFSVLTRMPPFIGVLLGLSILWIVTEVMHQAKDPNHEHSVERALQNIDVTSVLFFLGILSSVSALQSAGVLGFLAKEINKHLLSPTLEVVFIGLASSVIDNIPLVALVQGMYNLARFPLDSTFWTFLSYCAGTGGSILIIGSAAGVAAMSLVRIDFMWYLRRMTPIALLGYFVGIICFFLLK